MSPRLRGIRLRNRLLVGAGCAALGVASFFLCQALGTPSPQRAIIKGKPINSKTFVFKGEQELNSAMASLRKADWSNAIKCYSRLNTEDIEPTIAAWGALHAACIAYLSKAGDEVDVHYAAFQAALERPCPNLAGQEIMEQLRIVPEAIENLSAMTKIHDNRILGLAYCLSVRHMLEHGKLDDALMSVKNGGDAFLRCREKAYKEQMAEFTQTLEESYAHIFASAGKSKALMLMSEHKFIQAEACLNELTNEEREDKEELKVLIEVCEVAKEMQASLVKKMGDDYTPGMSGTALLEIVKIKKCINLDRAREICALLYMVQAEYRVAFEKNPYRNDSNSNEPFAVLMRDWKTRLGY